MKKIAMTVMAAAFALGAMGLAANAQIQRSNAVCLISTMKNSTSIVKNAGCYGGTGYCGCGPGWVSACAPRCCRCVPC